MGKVTMVPDEGTMISAYQNNADYGFIKLTQKTVIDNGNSGFLSKRNCLYRGSIEMLQAKLEENPTMELSGRIRVVEIPESVAKMVAAGRADKTNESHRVAIAELHRDLIKGDAASYAKAVDGFIKKNPKTDAVMFVNGERILRFQVYDATGKLEDIRVQADATAAAETIAPTEE